MRNNVEKIVFVGGDNVGKTQIIEILTLTEGKFTPKYYPTIGADVKKKVINNLTMMFWDTAGQDKFKSISSMYYRGANQFCLVFNPYDSTSYSKLNELLNEIKQSAPDANIILIANQCNEESESRKRQVTKEEAENFALEHSLEYHEVSAKTGEGINQGKKLESILVANANKRLGVDINSDASSSTENGKKHIENLKTWTLQKTKSDSEREALNTIVDILEKGMKITDKEQAKQYFKENKTNLNLELKKLQKSSYTKTFQNACTAIVACVACFGLIGLIPLAYNHYKHGDALLFWTKGNKQQAELAINMAIKDDSTTPKNN